MMADDVGNFPNCERFMVVVPVPRELIDDHGYDLWVDVGPEIERVFRDQLAELRERRRG